MNAEAALLIRHRNVGYVPYESLFNLAPKKFETVEYVKAFHFVPMYVRVLERNARKHLHEDKENEVPLDRLQSLEKTDYFVKLERFNSRIPIVSPLAFKSGDPNDNPGLTWEEELAMQEEEEEARRRAVAKKERAAAIERLNVVSTLWIDRNLTDYAATLERILNRKRGLTQGKRELRNLQRLEEIAERVSTLKAGVSFLSPEVLDQESSDNSTEHPVTADSENIVNNHQEKSEDIQLVFLSDSQVSPKFTGDFTSAMSDSGISSQSEGEDAEFNPPITKNRT